jgi:hypothetical protein
VTLISRASRGLPPEVDTNVIVGVGGAWTAGQVPAATIANPGNSNQRLNGKGAFGQSSYGIGATARGFLFESIPMALTDGGTSSTAGELDAILIGIPGGQQVTGCVAFVTTGSAGVTSGFFALYDTSFNLLRQTASITAAWNVTNAYVAADFSASYTPTNDTAVYVAVLTVGGAPILQQKNIGSSSVGAFGTNARATFRQTALAALPNPAVPVTTVNARWFGLY